MSVPLWESHFHKEIILLMSNQLREGRKDWKKWTLHTIKCVSLSAAFGVCWGPRLRRCCKHNSHLTIRTQPHVECVKQWRQTLLQRMNELIKRRSASYQIAFILWSGGSGRFMQRELCSREIRRALLQRAQFMNAVKFWGMRHLVTSSCFSSWMLSESD